MRFWDTLWDNEDSLARSFAPEGLFPPYEGDCAVRLLFCVSVPVASGMTSLFTWPTDRTRPSVLPPRLSFFSSFFLQSASFLTRYPTITANEMDLPHASLPYLAFSLFSFFFFLPCRVFSRELGRGRARLAFLTFLTHNNFARCV